MHFKVCVYISLLSKREVITMNFNLYDPPSRNRSSSSFSREPNVRAIAQGQLPKRIVGNRFFKMIPPYRLPTSALHLVKLIQSSGGTRGIDAIRTATKMKTTKIQWTVLISTVDVTERARGLPTRFSQRMSPDCLVTGGHCRIDLPGFRRIPKRSPFSRPATTA